MTKIRKIQLGQSLLETIFAIGILLIMVTVVLTLTTSNVIGQKASEFQVVANNLAREGIEVVRNIRDSNWLAGQTWDTGLTGSSNVAIAKFDSTNNTWVLSFTFTDDVLYTSTAPLRGIYSHNNSGEPSVFRRTLILDDICLDSSGQESIDGLPCDIITEQKIGIKITSRINWIERGKSHQVILEDLIYEWK